MISLERIIDWVSGKSRAQLARVVAYLIAPLLVLGLAAAGVYTPGLGLDFGKPIAVSTLHTEIDTAGRISEVRGIAMTLEPTESEFQIPLDTASTMWVSLDPELARANSSRLALTPSGLNGRWPLVGVSTPVTVVVNAKPGSEILLPGGRDLLEAWQPQSRRSLAFITSVLFACIFAFGMSVATSFPSRNRDKHAHGQKGANGHEEEIVQRNTIQLGAGGLRVLPNTELNREEVPGISNESHQ